MATKEVTRNGYAIMAATPWTQAGRRILCAIPTNRITPFVVWFETVDRITVSGHYCRTELEALALFNEFATSNRRYA